jgi:hypothetical protein
MTLKELKNKTLVLIEEANPDNPKLTDDPDISAKLNDVINQVMFELVRMKKIPKYVEMAVTEGEIIDLFPALEKECGYEVYQIAKVGGVKTTFKADGTFIKALESGTAEIEFYIFPEAITAKTKDSYEFELPADVLEIMPYGVAADLLKSDVSSNYGAIYAQEYEKKVQRLDPRYAMGSVYIDGGVSW